MSKDKGSKNVKKAPAVNVSKTVSDYQSGKKRIDRTDIKPVKK